jgi:hypothetical protein
LLHTLNKDTGSYDKYSIESLSDSGNSQLSWCCVKLQPIQGIGRVESYSVVEVCLPSSALSRYVNVPINSPSTPRSISLVLFSYSLPDGEPCAAWVLGSQPHLFQFAPGTVTYCEGVGPHILTDCNVRY